MKLTDIDSGFQPFSNQDPGISAYKRADYEMNKLHEIMPVNISKNEQRHMNINSTELLDSSPSWCTHPCTPINAASDRRLSNTSTVYSNSQDSTYNFSSKHVSTGIKSFLPYQQEVFEKQQEDYILQMLQIQQNKQ
jgi:hypothetical protein